MQKILIILSLTLMIQLPCRAQDSLIFKGQISAWALYNHGNDLPLHGGIRYIPQLNYKTVFKNDHKFDLEASANINGSAGFHPFDSAAYHGQLKPYRLWARYSTDQLEIRLGLQKINFGSASLLRPLMWFDQVDPRDPLRLTDGVWGILGRYYFLNNTNIWLWGLYGNSKPRGWEFAGTNKTYPELGGRIQVPVPAGEAALSFHHRVADTRNTVLPVDRYSKIGENRIGFDIKLDLVTGVWLEGSWVNKNRELGPFTNQEVFNAGIDYTFAIGNGLYVVYEQLLAAYDENAFEFKNTTSFSLLSLSYPIGLFDNLSGIVYFDWKNRNSYNFINWQKQFNKITLYFIGYLNPERYNIPTQEMEGNLFAGKGLQVMFVYNH